MTSTVFPAVPENSPTLRVSESRYATYSNSSGSSLAGCPCLSFILPIEGALFVRLCVARCSSSRLTELC